jgi:glycosyltransferase involved in cell wall biosynthesis
MNNRKLKIAQIAPLIERIPPKKYGGTERVIHALTEALVKRGHDVTLFASGDSLTSAKLRSVFPRSLREAKIRNLYNLNDLTLLNIGIAYQLSGQFDLIHDHNGLFSLPTANICPVPVVMTIHGPITASNKPLYRAMNKPAFVAISKSQAQTAPKEMTISGVVHNGLDLEGYPFSAENDGYLLFVGRICMEKGTHYAIDIAQMLNLPLIIAAKLDQTDVPYFNEYIGPRLSDAGISQQIRWIGEVNEEERNRLMSKALCLLHPATWKEPFGLTLIESLACGTPVVGFNKGSVPEIIKNGLCGYVVEDEEEMVNAVLNIGKIDRKQCRKYAVENFNSNLMADRYEEIYRRLIP